MNQSTKEARATFLSRTCFVCLEHVPETTGIYHASLRILTHQDCGTKVTALHRDYSHSPRGRWRRRQVVLQMLIDQREIGESM